MDLISTLFESTFWATATSLVPLIVPVVALGLVFKIVGDLLWK